ncbi:MFS transporter [Nocardia sp. NPDC059091]|uniref:MFS transporter n=1 Tax=unclassified Nocardia TaxID=2637762 RepID=UPI0036B3C84B
MSTATALTPPVTAVSTPLAAPARRWLGLSAIIGATLMNMLDTNVVNVALPMIRRDLGGSYATMQWIAAAYTLVLAVGLLTGGRFGDLFGRRRMFLGGTVGFVLASVACSLAASPEALIGGRVAQAAAATVMVPQCLGMIRDLFPDTADQPRAWAAFGATLGVASILGPIVAGLLIKVDLLGTGWRSIFWINVPLGLFALIGGIAALPRRGGDRTGGLDLLGVVLAGSGVGLLIYPLRQGREHGWPAWSLIMPVIGVAVLGIFVAQQRFRTAAGRTPLVRLSVFGRRSYSAGVLFETVFFIGIIGFSLGLGLMLQLGFGYSPIGASIAMAAWALGSFFGSAIGAEAPKLGRKVLHLGVGIMTAGLAGLYAVLHLVGTGLNAWELAGPLLVVGFGMGMVFVPMFSIIIGEIEDDEVGSASGLLESVQQLAGALGVAVLGTVFFNRFTHLGGTPRGNALIGMEHVTLVGLGLGVTAFCLAFLLPHAPRETH